MLFRSPSIINSAALKFGARLRVPIRHTRDSREVLIFLVVGHPFFAHHTPDITEDHIERPRVYKAKTAMKPARPAPRILALLVLAALLALGWVPDPVGEPEALVCWAPVPEGEEPAEALLAEEPVGLAAPEEGEPGAKGALVWVLGNRLAKQSA